MVQQFARDYKDVCVEEQQSCRDAAQAALMKQRCIQMGRLRSPAPVGARRATVMRSWRFREQNLKLQRQLATEVLSAVWVQVRRVASGAPSEDETVLIPAHEHDELSCIP